MKRATIRSLGVITQILILPVLVFGEVWLDGWNYRAEMYLPKYSIKPDLPLAFVKLNTRGTARPEGFDIRVTDSKGNIVKSRVMYCDTETFSFVIFEAKEDTARYYLFFGNPGIDTFPEKQLEVNRGLFLETRRFESGDIDSWEGMYNTIVANRKKFGFGMVEVLRQNTNIFGEEDNYISLYTGGLYCPKKSTYSFLANSDEASFIFIDGRKVAEWPGYHGITNRIFVEKPETYHHGEVELDSGYHRIDYYHAEASGPQLAVLLWRDMTQNNYQVVPMQNYLYTYKKAIVSKVENISSGYFADFQFYLDSVYFQELQQACKVKFVNRSYFRNSKDVKFRWEFGDRLSSNEENPDHVYLRYGNYNVKMTVILPGGKTEEVIKTLTVKEEPAETPNPCIEDEYVEDFAGYDWKKMDKEDFWNVIAFVNNSRNENRTELLVLMTREYLKSFSTKKNMTADKRFYECYKMIGKALTSMKKYEEAVKNYNEAMEFFRENESLRVEILLNIADVYFKQRDFKTAGDRYEEIIDGYAGLKDRTVRIAMMRMGDVCIELGDFKSAKEFYEKAGGFEVKQKLADKQKSVIKGSYIKSAERAFFDKNPDEAVKSINSLQEDFPEEKLKGYPTLLLGKAYFLKGDYDEAIRNMETILKVNAWSTFTPEALMLLGDCNLKKNDLLSAMKYYERVFQSYPGGKISEEAREKLKKTIELKDKEDMKTGLDDRNVKYGSRNLAFDGSFEKSEHFDTGTMDKIEHWIMSENTLKILVSNPSYSIKVCGVDGIDGKQCLYVSPINGNYFSMMSSKEYIIGPGQEVFMEVWTKTTGWNGGGGINIGVICSDGTIYYAVQQSITHSEDRWTRYNGKLVFPTSRQKSPCRIYVYPTHCNGDMYFDNIKMTIR